MWAFRQFAQSLGLDRARWKDALLHVLTLPAAQARASITTFEAWFIRRGFTPIVARKFTYMVRPFFAFAYDAGVISWKFPHQKHDWTASLWKRCSREFEALAREWLTYLTNLKYATGTLRAYRMDLLRFGHFLASRKTRPGRIDYPTVQAWVHAARSAGKAPSTAEKYVTVAKMFCEWLASTKKLPRNPFRALPRRKYFSSSPRHVSEQTILDLIKAATDVRDRALIEFLYATGCRVSEASGMDLAHLSLKARNGRCMGKGSRERAIYLNKPAVRAIQAYLPQRQATLERMGRQHEQALFVNCFGKRLFPKTMCGDVVRVSQRAGLRHITPHVIRHSFATHLLNRGAPFELLRVLLGHANLVSTATYAHLVTARVRQDYRKARPRQ